MAKRPESTRTGHDRRRRVPEHVDAKRKRDPQPRGRTSTREQRPSRSAPATTPISRPVDTAGRPKNAAQAKARAKARKAKAPRVIRRPLRERLQERLLVRLASIDLNPRHLVSRVPFVVLVIGALGIGLGVTLWLSTDAAESSYQLGRARQTNQALLQQKEALERDVMAAQAAPALAESARNLGMIPSKDTAHLVQDPTGAWVVVGKPKPAEGVPPPPLNAPLPDDTPPPPPAPAPRVVDPRELAVRIPPQPAAVPGLEVPVVAAPGAPLVAPAPGAPLAPLAPLVAPAPGASLAPGAAVAPSLAPVPADAVPPPVDAGAVPPAAPTVPSLTGPPINSVPPVAGPAA
jgi:hypothetical protein